MDVSVSMPFQLSKVFLVVWSEQDKRVRSHREELGNVPKAAIHHVIVGLGVAL